MFFLIIKDYNKSFTPVQMHATQPVQVLHEHYSCRENKQRTLLHAQQRCSDVKVSFLYMHMQISS